MKKGFTLIELMIYTAIVAAVLTVSSSFAWNMIRNDIKSASLREVQQNAWFSMEKITRAVRSGQNPSIFTLNAGVLYQNGVPLTTDQVRVTNLQFTSVSNTYKINLSVEYYNPGGRNEYQASMNLESTAMPRL
ncbi:MAG: prepilin-type N-terminal cleavage/methylation domain-containing protein [bacterium]|nr:prepilin-type N-terminal cleavage/methylation domain-containing protein [bacterium]